MKIVLLLALVAVVAETAASVNRRVHQIEGNELEDLNVDDGRDKRHLASSSSKLHSSRCSVNSYGKKLGIRTTSHKTMHKSHVGLQRGRPLVGLGTGLYHTTNRKTFGSGIRGPLGRVDVHASSYDHRFGLSHGK